ncbi:MAG: MBL fold metallo-hydrolase [Promethearchaeota archaeon]|jgi:glyoxylase-like metal-dependent hydrolase (beta-lactamase superfamily II)
MNIIKITSNFYDIQLDLKGTDSTSTLSSWVYKDKNLCFLLDTGPTSSLETLRNALDKVGIKKNDLQYILISHIHQDHAGGVGKLIEFFPKAQVICHPRGIKHLINPKKLWEGSLKVLGKVAELYGEITPVPEDRIVYQEEIAEGKIRVIDTSGHAPHHQSYLFDKYLLIGEAAGVNIPIPGKTYIRPATPPVFNYEISKFNIQKLLDGDLGANKICFAHYGMKDDVNFMLSIAKEQLDIWVRVINKLLDLKNDTNYFEKVIGELKKEDTYFANINVLDSNKRANEFFFVRNSIRGITDYLEKKKNS